MRDEFQQRIKRTIALRVGYECSNPTCGVKTTGPQIDPTGVINIGVAAHITAAASGGPRYNPAASPKDRKSTDNGIWLCQSCAKLIDDDENRFSEPLLRHWKKVAEDRALRELGRRSPFDRADTPVLEIPEPRLSALPTVLSSKTLENLSGVLVPETVTNRQIEMLGSGRGAMGQSYVIVAVGLNHGWDWRIGLFTGGEFGWEQTASIRLEGQKGHQPEAVYFPGTPGALALTHVHSYGTGLFRRSTSWYRIARGEPYSLFTYPREFYVMGWGMPFGRRLTSNVLVSPSRLIDGAIIKMQFDISYTMENEVAENKEEQELFSLAFSLSMGWKEEAGRFVPQAPDDDFSCLEEVWGEGTDGFVQRNADRLKQLSRYGNTNQKKFIRSYFGI